MVSTAEAAYMAAASAVKKQFVILEFMFSDNQAPITHPIASMRYKHIEVKHLFFRERVASSTPAATLAHESRDENQAAHPLQMRIVVQVHHHHHHTVTAIL
jgi:hypothetical protein